MELLKNLHWRYATKRYNPEVKVSNEKVMKIIEAARMAPTSSGLQPFEMILVQNQEIKEKMQPIAMNQAQIKECSHVLVFAVWDNYTEERIDSVFANMEAIRALEKGVMDEYKQGLKDHFASLSLERQIQHAARQAYIALGMALVAAAELKVDTTPMEGFKNDELDILLGLDKRGLKSVVILAIGERDHENDWLAPQKKVRFELTAMVTVIE